MISVPRSPTGQCARSSRLLSPWVTIRPVSIRLARGTSRRGALRAGIRGDAPPPECGRTSRRVAAVACRSDSAILESSWGRPAATAAIEDLAMADSDLPLILEPDELERRLGRPGLLVVDLGAASTHARQHVPGAVHLDYARIVAPRPPVGGLLPDDRRIGEVLSSIGMTARSHVVAYDDEGGAKACRLLWTLDVIGHRGASLLNGGLQAWVGEGHRTESGVAAPARGDYRVTGRTEAAVDAAY